MTAAQRIAWMAPCLLALLLPLAVDATIYAVSPTGSDTAACTETAPCKSFTTVLPLLRPGDTLVLQPGTYQQNLKIGNPPVTSGTSAAPITVKGQPGVVIQGSGVEAATVNGNTQYWTLEDLTFDCSKLSSATSTVNCMSINWRSGPQESPQATSHITLRRVKLLNTVNPAGSNSIGLSAAINDLVVEDVHINGTSLAHGDYQGSHGMYISGNRQVVRGGLVENAGGMGIQRNDSGFSWTQGNRDNLIIGVQLRNNGKRSAGGGQGGIAVYHNQQGTRLIGNVITGNRGPGILDEGGENTGTIVVHNTLVANTAQCYTGGSDSAHYSTATTFQNNICHQNGAGLRFGTYAGDGAVVANILSDKTPPESTAGDTAAHANLVGVDPQFVDASAGNYQPQASSPACQSGEPMTGVTRDKVGRGTGRSPTRGALPCVGQAPPEPPQPQPPAGTLACRGELGAKGAITMACQPQEVQR